MAKQPKKAKQRKDKLREEKKRQARARAALARTPRGRMRAAARAPVRECLINANWRDNQLATVVLSRNGPDGVACVAVLVDLGCLGIKNCLAVSDLTERDYQHLLESIPTGEPLTDCDPALALKLVETGLAYASELGFRAQEDWRVARELFVGLDSSACDQEIPCGHDGRPQYVSGPNDDVQAILARLDARVGPDGYDFIASAEDSGAPPYGEDWGAISDAELMLETGVDEQTAATWLDLRRTENRVVNAITSWVDECFGDEMWDEANQEFLLWKIPDEFDEFDEFEDEEEELDPQLVVSLSMLFMSWFCFTWTHDPHLMERGDWPEVPSGLAFLQAHPDLDQGERRFIEAACQRPISIYVVKEVHKGRSMTLRCLFTGNEYEVLERSASTTINVGGQLLARVVPLDGVALLCGLSALVLPPRYTPALIDARNDLAPKHGPWREEHLAEFDFELRDIYAELMSEALNPPAPQLANTDGEPLAHTTLTYELRCSPREALDSLKTLHLDHEESVDVLLADSTADEHGELVTVDFPWLREGASTLAGGGRTVLGHLHIDGNTMTVEVNSEARAQRFGCLTDELLGNRAKCVSMQTAPPELLTASHAPPLAAPPSREDTDSSSTTPEARALLQEFMADHWKAWLDEEIPFLHDRTPRQAATTPEGRELLEALLCDLQWSDAAVENPAKPDVASLRQQLGM